MAQARQWIRDHVPPGLRLVAGLFITVAGGFGFLPVLGFWMIPLGLAIMAMDVKPLLEKFRKRR